MIAGAFVVVVDGEFFHGSLPSSRRSRLHHAERDRRRSADPVHPNEKVAGQPIRSSTTGEAAKPAPAAPTTTPPSSASTAYGIFSGVSV